jgi:transcriptional regulator with XRE-family HTH domain
MVKINEKIKELRKIRGISQDEVACELGLSQSQYSRREKGEIKFLVDEILKISKILKVSVAHIYGEENTSFTLHTQNGGVFGQYITVHEKLIEQYEKRIKEKDELIELLKKNKL